MMNNRLHNCTNPYQGTAKKVLCVCSAGLLRSPTAAVVLNKAYGYNTRSCGMDISHALIPFDNVLATWADEIVVMEDYQLAQIPEEFKHKAVSLGIQDSHEYMSPILQTLIEGRYIVS